MAATTINNPIITADTNSTVKPADMYQVVLWNDDHTEAGFVVRCIMQVFKHDSQLAAKIMLEAHNNGKAIAEVEGQESANLHREQLQSFGLTVTVEKILGEEWTEFQRHPPSPGSYGGTSRGTKGRKRNRISPRRFASDTWSPCYSPRRFGAAGLFRFAERREITNFEGKQRSIKRGLSADFADDADWADDQRRQEDKQHDWRNCRRHYRFDLRV